jgi:hypothetical protein
MRFVRGEDDFTKRARGNEQRGWFRWLIARGCERTMPSGYEPIEIILWGVIIVIIVFFVMATVIKMLIHDDRKR